MTHEEFLEITSVGEPVDLTFEEFIKNMFAGELDPATIATLQMGWNAGVKAEREACARLVHKTLTRPEDPGFAVAQMIRARGD